MDHDEGLALLGQEGWLSKTPDEFRKAILSRCNYEHVEAGKLVQTGGEQDGELIGLAQGIVELRTVLGRADTPLMHFVHPVFWFGYIPILTGQPRTVAATARTDVQLVRVPHAEVRALLDGRPDSWRHLMPLAISYGDVASKVAVDLLIRNSERRCAAVLLRLSGHRFTIRQDRHGVEIGITQEELSGAANLSHSSVHGILKRLADRGLVKLRYRGLQILDPGALRAFADQE